MNKRGSKTEPCETTQVIEHDCDEVSSVMTEKERDSDRTVSRGGHCQLNRTSRVFGVIRCGPWRRKAVEITRRQIGPTARRPVDDRWQTKVYCRGK